MIELEAGDARVVVSPTDGGRLASLVIGGRERLVTGSSADDPKLWGIYPLAPWAGRIRRGRLAFDGRTYDLPIDALPHAIHGTVYRRAWDVEADGTLVTELGPDWPFGGVARQKVALDAAQLRCTLEVHAETHAMPVTAGFHPWFARPVDFAVQPAQVYVRDGDGIPDGTLAPPGPLPWDDCFIGLPQPPRLTFADDLSLTLTSDADHWVIFTPEHAVCIEPQTGPPDGPNIAPRIVEPGSPLEITMTLSWSS